MKRIKMLWDFRGPDAAAIALHHSKHLDEYAQHEGLENTATGIESITDNHFVAYMIVNEVLVTELRNILKPHRGQLFSE